MSGGLAQKVDWSQRWAQWKYTLQGPWLKAGVQERCPHNDSLPALSRAIGVLRKGLVAKLLAGSFQACTLLSLPRLLIVS